MLSVRRLSVRGRKRALWIGTAVSWCVAASSVTLSLVDPAAFHWRTVALVTLTVAAMLFSTSVIASLIQAPDVAYRIGVEHGRSSCHCHPEIAHTGTGQDAIVLRFPGAWSDS